MATGQQKILEVNYLIKRRNRFRTSYAPAVGLGILRNWKSGGRGTAYNSRVCAGGARLAEHEAKSMKSNPRSGRTHIHGPKRTAPGLVKAKCGRTKL
jgi:hypothetical protein